MEHYTYLLINFFTVIICFIFSFHHKIKFSRHFAAFVLCSVLVATVFIIWDAWFTKIGVWWFNDQYLVGIKIFQLPIEELMFFICIPFACVFTYFCLNKFFNFDWNPLPEKIFVIGFILILVVLAFIYCDFIYPFITFVVTALSLFALSFILKVQWIGKASVIYLILMPGFIAVNGILTGTGLDAPIVNYNPARIIGFRIFTIPVEDTIYGYTLILWNLYFFQKFKKKVRNYDINKMSSLPE
ncbi:lycopene cyclase domain-containing protein [Chryseobacterium sp. GMJ5]|uniref:Lycopene cyclase domain-containing protein n=1 Tax=Chryseobacterium gilvum TaxID=2976534 RepID=A0ABT2VU51_9FLAO|nr:lycopene cyclase domain-containing protein [Chryseobacterium gilvum]MCU7613518.1 lycopene cyclase domain-containing protein [Chryseobacterium gilvum]